MEISEQVLYSSLAQMLNKNYKSGKTINIDYDKSISVVKSPKINNNIALKFAPYIPRIFVGTSSFTEKTEGSN